MIVDDQRDIMRLIHSTLDTLGHELNVIEAPSGEEALLEASRVEIDLLVADYRLPGITGIELMQKIRGRTPDVKVVLITGMTDKKSRDEMLEAGAVAIFDKPIPLADFLDVVERTLGLTRTILPPEESSAEENGKGKTLSDLLANFRKQTRANAVFLLSDRGRVLARAGDLRDGSMEVSLISALMAIYNAAQKVTRFVHQDYGSSFHTFRGGDQDLLLLPVDAVHALLVAGEGLAGHDHLLATMDAMLGLQEQVQSTLRSMGVVMPDEDEPAADRSAAEPVDTAPKVSAEEFEALLAQSKKKKLKPNEVESFWEEAVDKTGAIPLDPDKLTYEQARKLGLAPDDKKK